MYLYTIPRYYILEKKTSALYIFMILIYDEQKKTAIFMYDIRIIKKNNMYG